MKEKEEKGIMEDGEGASKRDFLKVLGAGIGNRRPRLNDGKPIICAR